MDLATAQSHLDDSLTQLAAARKAAGYGVGDMSKTSQSVTELQGQVTYWSRIVESFSAESSGVRNSMASVPRFR